VSIGQSFIALTGQRQADFSVLSIHLLRPVSEGHKLRWLWNDCLFAVTVAHNPNIQPLTVGLNNLAGSYIVEWNVQMAGALMAAMPTLLVYIFLGRYFMRGLLAGSLKG